jgi:hypothetical protein
MYQHTEYGPTLTGASLASTSEVRTSVIWKWLSYGIKKHGVHVTSVAWPSYQFHTNLFPGSNVIMEKHRHNGDLAILTLLFLRKLAKNCFTVAREVQVPLCPHGHTFIHDIPDRSSDYQSEGKRRDAPQGTGPTMTERLAMNTSLRALRPKTGTR